MSEPRKAVSLADDASLYPVKIAEFDTFNLKAFCASSIDFVLTSEKPPYPVHCKLCNGHKPTKTFQGLRVVCCDDLCALVHSYVAMNSHADVYTLVLVYTLVAARNCAHLFAVFKSNGEWFLSDPYNPKCSELIRNIIVPKDVTPTLPKAFFDSLGNYWGALGLLLGQGRLLEASWTQFWSRSQNLRFCKLYFGHL